MTTIVSDFSAWTANDTILIDDVDINLKLVDLNYATFISPSQINVDDVVTIRFNDQRVFYGKVSQCKKLTRTVDTTARFEIEVVEYAEQLKYKYLIDGQYSGMFIVNNGTKKLGDYVAQIIANTGWQDVSDAEYKNLTQVSGGGESGNIPSMGFSVCSVYSALQRLVVNIFGLGLWFEYPESGQLYIRYGEVNKTAEGFPVPTNIKLVEKNIDCAVTGIVVYGDDNKLRVAKGNLNPTVGGRVIAYRYSQCQNEDELTWIAQRIYEDRMNISYRYEVEFPAGWYNVREGDVIYIYDNITGLPNNVNGHGVKDVRVSTEKTVLGLGAKAVTIFDIYSDRLRIIDGDLLAYSPVAFDTGYCQVACASATTEYGAEVVSKFIPAGETFLGDFIVFPYIIDNDSYGGYTVFGIGAGASSVEVIGAGSSAAITFEEAMDTDWFPWTWKYAEIEVSYIFSEDNTQGAEVAWDCIFAATNGATQSLLPVITDGLQYQTATSYRRTMTHRWRVGESTNTPWCFPYITMTNAGTTDSVKILDFSVSLAIHYDVPYSQGQLSYDVVVQARLDAGEWFTIFDFTNPTPYVNAYYNLSKMYGLTNSNFTMNEEHAISFRAMGNGNVLCGLKGSFLAFDEKTKIIT
mgnify:CR=1 FL=1